MVESFFSLRNLFYFLYAVVLLVVLLYVRFPAEKFKLYCEKRAEYYLQVDSCTIEKIRYNFPLTLDFYNIRLQKTAAEEANTARIDELTVLAKPEKPGREFEVKGKLYGGSLQSELTIDYTANTFQLKKIAFSKLQLKELMDSIHLGERETQGTMSLSGTYKALIAKPFSGAGSGKAGIVNGSFHLKQPVLGLSDLSFNSLQFQFSQDKEKLELSDGSLSAEQLNVVFAGGVTVNPLPADSQLKLKGTIAPSGKLYQAIPSTKKYVNRLLRRYKMKELPFRIDGTVKIPTFRFGR